MRDSAGKQILLGRAVAIVVALSMITSAGAFLAFSTAATGTRPGDIQDMAPDDMIKLKYRTFDPLKGSPYVSRILSTPEYPPAVKAPYIIQSEGKITEQWKTGLMKVGAEIISYIPDNALLVLMDADTKARIDELSYLRWCGNFEPAYKISPELFEKTGLITVDVSLFPHTTNGYIVKGITRIASGKILDVVNTKEVNVVRAEVDASWLCLLASRPEVKWISEYSQPWIQNADATQLCQSGSISGGHPIFAHGIEGDLNSDTNFLIGCVTDMGIDPNHEAFSEPGKIVDIYVPDGSGADFGFAEGNHGTHTACTMLGDSPPWLIHNNNDGHALGARLINQDIGLSTEPSYVYPPQDYYHELFEDAELGDPVNGHIGGASVHLCSWGGSGTYSDVNVQIDQYVWDSQDYVICFPVGGSEAQPNQEAESKNILTGGSTNSAGTAVSSFSNPGPTSDGRYKPDICVPGESVTSADTGSPTSYTTMQGTSMATAAMAGCAILVQEYYWDGFYPIGMEVSENAFMPSTALVKATIINGAVDMGTTNIPNNNEGWGRIHLDNSLYFSGDARESCVVDQSQGMVTGDSLEYHFGVTDNSVPFKATLVWSDYPGDPSAAKMLVNDLDLTVTDPGATEYKGNVFSGGWSQTGGSYDDLNNIECVYLNSPISGIYTVRIDANSIPIGPQNFALVVTANFDDGYGRVMMDRPVYDDSDIINLRVEDINNPSSSVDVVVTNNISGDQETVTLSSTGVNSCVFTGSIASTIGGTHQEDGLLQVSDCETITATYTDSNPAHDDTAMAHVDIHGPVITDVWVANIMGTSALVTWKTSENADSTVYYGTNPNSTTWTDNVTITDLQLQHTVPLTGLTENTKYWFDVESSDWRGRSVRDYFGGNHYTFTTRSPGTGGALILFVDDDDGSLSSTGHPFEVDWCNNLDYYGWTYNVWEIVTLGSPTYTDLNQAPMIIWNCADGYPVIGTDDRNSLEPYLDQALTGSGTVPMAWLIGQDLGWDMCDPSGTDQALGWYTDYMAADYRQDSCNEANTEDGGRGDEASGDVGVQLMDVGHAINIYGYDNVDLEEDAFAAPPSARFWPDDIANDVGLGGMGEIVFDYNNHNSATSGNPGNAAEIAQQSGGTGGAARIVYSAYAPEMISTNNNGATDWDPPNIDPERAGMLDQKIQWLLGGDHPTIDLTYPTGGETFLGNNINLQWAVTAASTIDLYYSPNGGQEYINIVSELAGTTTSYNWDITGLEDGESYRVKVVALGTAIYATLTDYDESSNFTIDHGVDNTPPITVPGSVCVSENPANASDLITLTATIDDTNTGNSNIAAAQWKLDNSTWPAEGTNMMSASDGSFNTPLEDVTTIINTTGWTDGWHDLWVRGKDAGDNWASSEKTEIFINAIPGFPEVISIGGTGWQFISFAYAMSGPVETVFDDSINGDGGTTWDYIQWYDANDPVDHWKSYATFKPAVLNDMPTATNQMGFWINIIAIGDGVLTTGTTGDYSGSTVNINLYTGWNLVGYPSATPRAGDVTLPAEANLVSVYDLAEQYRIRDEPKGAVTFTEGNAYWVRVTADCTWQVNP